MELPLFVVHGAVVWKVLLVLVVATSLAAVALARHRKERKRVAAYVTTHLGEVTPLRAGVVSLRGKLSAGSASTSQTGEKQETHERSAELTLDHEGEKVAIAGEVSVHHGTQTRVAWLQKTTTRSVKAGDEVIVTGTAVRRAEDDAGYRDSGAGWEVGNFPRIVAVRPQPRARPNGPVLTLFFAAVFGVVGYGVFALVGSRALKRAEARDSDVLQTSLGNFDSLAIAAAMPGKREQALKELSNQLERSYPATEDVFQMRLAVRELMGECRASLLLRSVRLEETVAAARACGDHELAAQALAFLGKYEDAWNEPGRVTRSVEEGVIAIATGRWNRAAIDADARATEYLARERGKYYTDRDARRYALNMGCLGALFRSWEGDKTAFDGIEGRMDNDRCKVFAALALPEAEQSAALAAITFSEERDYDAKMLAREVHLSIDPNAPFPAFYSHSIADAVGFGARTSLWFAPAQLAHGRTDLDPRQQSRLLSFNAGHRAYRGDLAGARKLLVQSIAAEPGGHYAYTDELALGILDPVATLPDKTGEYIHPGITEIVELRKGRTPAGVRHVTLGTYGECEKRLLPAIHSAQAGDGAQLAAVFRECHVYWGTAQKALLAVLPLVKTNREELAAAVRHFKSEISTYSLEHLPFRMLEDLAWFRNLARAIGDTEAQAAWQAIFDRHAVLLEDRQKLIAFWMWGD